MSLFLPLRRKRLVLWLLRAYLRRWLKTLLFFFILGVVVAIASFKLLPKILNLENETQKIGLVGSFTTDTLPLEIQKRISLGLTELEEDGSVSPSLARSWEISSDGKIYKINLRDDTYFQDGKKLKADDINYNFKDARLTILDEKTIQFTLGEPFSPFLVAISQPIFKKGLVGVGEYQVKKIDFNGPFISSLTLRKNGGKLIYRFYPTEEALKTAFVLGEVDTIKNLHTAREFQDWPTLKVEKSASSQELVAIFFNTRDGSLSQKNIRQALTYALPDSFEWGEVAFSPLSFKSFAYQKQPEKFLQNFPKARELFGAPLIINLTVDEKLKDQAQLVAKNWEEIGVKTDLKTTSSVPDNFQAFLGIYRIPADPDQYLLWHSTQPTNITGYNNPKIDKLLEDGRKTQDKLEREKIYRDFQKYLVDDVPAAFLYYPTVYTLRRK